MLIAKKIAKLLVQSLLLSSLLMAGIFIFKTNYANAEVAPTIHSVPAGGRWSAVSTWVEGRLPSSDDIVEINGTVELNQNPAIAGAVITHDSKLQTARNYRSTLTVNGEFINNGSIVNGGDMFELKLTGDITNNGLWDNYRTILIGSSPRQIDTLAPIGGYYLVLGDDLEITGNPIFAGAGGYYTNNYFSFNSNTITVNYPNTISFQSAYGTGTIVGTGQASFKGVFQASLEADIEQVSFEYGAYINGTIKANKIVFGENRQNIAQSTVDSPEIIFKGPGIKNLMCHPNTIFKGQVTIESEATISSQQAGYYCPVNFEGDVINSGTLENGSAMVTFFVSGNITNSGTWDVSRTYLTWPAVDGADHYQFNIAETKRNWPDPIELTYNRYDASDLMNNTRYWRVRASVNDSYSDWSETRWINQADALVINPVIIIPGIMGSWYADEEWRMDPILRTYDNLIEAMLADKYEYGATLFTLPYDWEQSNVLTASLLKEKIDQIKQITGQDKVDIVAHSMGGLVARSYIQSSDYDNDVDQLIFLGTPHQGSPEAYLPYEGAYFQGKLARIKEFYISTKAIKHGYIGLAGVDLVGYIEEQVLSTEQLLPIYDYLQEKVNDSWQFRLYPVNYPRNLFLENLNTTAGLDALKQRVNITNIISSTGSDNTLSSIQVVPDPDIYDNKWVYGYPEGIENDNPEALINGPGDNTVPKVSLESLQNVSVIEYPATSHTQIVTKSQQDVIEILTGSRPTAYYEGSWGTARRILFLRPYSPVDFQVIAPDGQIIGKDFEHNANINQIENAFYSGFEAEAEFVTIINPIDGTYKIITQGTGSGTYDFGASYITDKAVIDRFVYKIPVEVGVEDVFEFNLDSASDDPLPAIVPEDQTPPEISLVSPEEKQYLHSDLLPLDYTVLDHGSGIKNYQLWLDNTEYTGENIDLFFEEPGQHEFTITAEDRMGNQSGATVIFEVIATLDSLESDINRAYELNWITTVRAKNKLLAIANQAKHWYDKYIQLKNKSPWLASHIKSKLVSKLDYLESQLRLFERLGMLTSQGSQLLYQQIEYIIINL